MVGAAGFEPATYCSQSNRANQTALRPDAPYKISRGNGLFNFDGRDFRAAGGAAAVKLGALPTGGELADHGFYRRRHLFFRSGVVY